MIIGNTTGCHYLAHALEYCNIIQKICFCDPNYVSLSGMNEGEIDVRRTEDEKRERGRR